ncbi:MAG: phage tail protein [Bacteroidales bacterium]|nr:phage tail protein [Bacteroidales bacterium]
MALYYPPTGFHYFVRFEKLHKGIPDIGFQKVSGINSTINTEEYQEGGENRFKHRLPNPPSFSNLILERGMLIGSQLMQWFNDSIEGFKFEPSDVTVILLNDLHIPIQAWNFVNAIPVKWTFSDLNAMENKVFIETVELSYQYYKRIDVTDLISLVK